MSLAEAIIGIFAPHVCIVCEDEGSILCRNCWWKIGSKKSEQCYKCRKPSKNSKTCKSCLGVSRINHVWVRTKYVFTPKDLVHALKFERAKEAHKILADAMFQAIPKLNEKTIIVPIRTATGRKRERGYDQSELIARELSRKIKLPYSPILLRLGQSRQVGAKKKDRVKQLKDSYIVNKYIKGSHILLVDDVLTTGSTLEAAATTIRKAGARKVNAVVFARAL